MSDDAADPGPEKAEESTPLLRLTDEARVKVLEARADEPDPEALALWVEVSGISGATYGYEMYFRALSEAGEAETVLHNDDLSVVIGAGSAEKLRGATLDFTPNGMVMNNPNSPSPATGSYDGPPPDLSGDLPQQVIQILETQINPAIASHGGMAELVAVEEGIAYLRLGGGCQGCGMASVTLSQGIEVALSEAIPEIVGVRDVTDHASGENPFYESAKK